MTLNAFAFLCLTALFTAVSNLLVRSSLARVADFSLSRTGVLNLIREPMFLAGGDVVHDRDAYVVPLRLQELDLNSLSPLRGPHLFLRNAGSILLSWRTNLSV